MAFRTPRKTVVPKREGLNVKPGLRSGADNEDDVFGYFESYGVCHGIIYNVERTHADADADVILRLLLAPHQGKALTVQLKSGSGRAVNVPIKTSNVFQGLIGGLASLALSDDLYLEIFESDEAHCFWNHSVSHKAVYQDLMNHYGDGGERCFFLFIVTFKTTMVTLLSILQRWLRTSS